MTDVVHRVDGSTLLVEINRPHRANALPDNRISSVVITGSSKRFSAGADLATLTGTLEDLTFDDALEQLCRRITHSPLPVVAAVEGACFGAAVDLAWACDAVVVSEEARFAPPSTRLGILYNPRSVARLHSRLGSATLRRLMVLQQELAGRELSPDSAIVAPTGAAAATAMRLVQQVSADRHAMAATKALRRLWKQAPSSIPPGGRRNDKPWWPHPPVGRPSKPTVPRLRETSRPRLVLRFSVSAPTEKP